MELSSPPSPPPLPSNGFSESIHVPHTDTDEPRYCTTIECNNNDDSNVSNILINSSSENHCAAANESKRANERTVAVNGNAFDFSSIDVDDSNTNDQSDVNTGYTTAAAFDEMDNHSMVPVDDGSAVDSQQNQCSFDSIGGSMLVVDSMPYKEGTIVCAESVVATHSDEITKHSVDNAESSAVEIVANIPTPSNSCHGSTAKTESSADALTDEQHLNCDDNDDADDDYGDGDNGEAEAEEEEEEEAIFHFLGKANEIVRLYSK